MGMDGVFRNGSGEIFDGGVISGLAIATDVIDSSGVFGGLAIATDFVASGVLVSIIGASTSIAPSTSSSSSRELSIAAVATELNNVEEAVAASKAVDETKKSIVGVDRTSLCFSLRLAYG